MIDLSITQQFLTLAVNDKGKLSTFDQNGAICLIAGAGGRDRDPRQARDDA